MTYTYTWTNAEHASLKREDENGNVAFVPADPGNRDYAEFCNCGATAAEYVAPPPPPPSPEPTTEEKINNLLTDYGLTRDELKVALEASAPAA